MENFQVPKEEQIYEAELLRLIESLDKNILDLTALQSKVKRRLTKLWIQQACVYANKSEQLSDEEISETSG